LLELPGRLLAIARTYTELHDALRARSNELEVSRETIDDIAGFESGYTAKLLSPVPMKRLGLQSLGPVLTVLGLALVVVEDHEGLRRISHRLKKRNHASVRMPTRKRHKRLGPEWGRLMSAKRNLKLSPRRRSQISRHAAEVKWRAIRFKRAAMEQLK
jgi:hypothetical protein